MSHMVEQWIDRNGQRRSTCKECEETWPCPSAAPPRRPAGYLVKGRLTVNQIVAEVARGFDVRVKDILSACNKRHVAMARQCAMAVVKEATDMSYSAIGDYFGRHHTTVMHGVERVLADPELCEQVRLVVDELNPPPRLFAVDDMKAM